MADRRSGGSAGQSAAWFLIVAVIILALGLVGYLALTARPGGGPAAVVDLPSPKLPALPDPEPMPLPRPVPAG